VRVGYTIEQCWHRVPGGTAVAALEVARELAEFDGIELVGVSAWHRRPPEPPWVPPVPVRRQPVPGRLVYDAWSRLGRPRIGGVDLVHATTPIIPPTTRPLIATVHDLAWRADPAGFTARGRRLFDHGFEQLRARAVMVICSSKATAEACRAEGIEPDRLRVVLLGVRPQPVTPDEVALVRRRYRLERPYVLAVGTIEPRKNLAALAAAHARAATGTELVIAGPSGWGQVDVPGAARMLGFVPAADLHALYAGAEAFAYPSLREGFGLPVLEAMSQGTAVVTSRGTATEEVAGGAAVLIEPTDADDLVRGLIEVLDRRAELGPAGRLRAAELTWRRSAEATAAIYREIAAR
jgi:glycosyltransferase involved in cell wall biosynthesis